MAFRGAGSLNYDGGDGLGLLRGFGLPSGAQVPVAQMPVVKVAPKVVKKVISAPKTSAWVDPVTNPMALEWGQGPGEAEPQPEPDMGPEEAGKKSDDYRYTTTTKGTDYMGRDRFNKLAEIIREQPEFVAAQSQDSAANEDLQGLLDLPSAPGWLAPLISLTKAETGKDLSGGYIPGLSAQDKYKALLSHRDAGMNRKIAMAQMLQQGLKGLQEGDWSKEATNKQTNLMANWNPMQVAGAATADAQRDLLLQKLQAEIERINAQTANIGKKTDIIGKGTGKPTKFENTLDDRFAKDWADYDAGGGFANIQAQLDQLAYASDQVLKGKSSGGILNLFATGTGNVGKTLMPGPSAVRDSAHSAIVQTLKSILGSQFRAEEGEAIKKLTYDEAQPPEENARRLRIFSDAVRKKAEAKEAAGAWVKGPGKGSLKGFPGNANVTLPVSELRSLYGEGGGSPKKSSAKSSKEIEWAD
jgi:hypothetical protein